MAQSSVGISVARRLREAVGFLRHGPDSDRLRMWVWAALLLVPAAAYLLWGIGTRAILPWDESRLAVNAIEMRHTGPSLVTTYGFQPDLWNTKPPLVIWLMWASMQLFGPTEWAFRLPSAVAALATLALTWSFAWRVSRSVLVAGFSALILVCSFGFSGSHVAFTGDYDATLILLTTAYGALLFLALSRAKPTMAAALGIGLLVAAAVLTKGIAGPIPGAGVLVYLLLTRRLGRPLHWRYVAGGLVGVLVIAGFYMAREAASPGYLAATLANDLGRYGKVSQGHAAPLWFYVQHAFWNFDFSIGLLALPLVAAAWKGSPRLRFAALYCLCLGATTLVVFSLSHTKLRWYAAPSYPFLAVACALGLKAVSHTVLRPAWRATALTLAGACLIVSAVVWKASMIAGMADPSLRPYGQVLDELGRRGARTVTVLDSGVENADGLLDYAPQLRFYALRAAEHGEAVAHAAVWPQSREGAGQVIASCDPMWAAALRGPRTDTDPASGCVSIRMEDAPQASPIGEREVDRERQARSVQR